MITFEKFIDLDNNSKNKTDVAFHFFFISFVHAAALLSFGGGIETYRTKCFMDHQRTSNDFLH